MPSVFEVRSSPFEPTEDIVGVRGVDGVREGVADAATEGVLDAVEDFLIAVSRH